MHGLEAPHVRIPPGRVLTLSRPNMAGLSALVVGAPSGLPRGELWREGMADLGDESATGAWLNTVTGGAVADIAAKLARVETALKVSTAAALGSAALALFLAFRRR